MAISRPKTDIGIYEADVRATLAKLVDANIVRRIWRDGVTNGIDQNGLHPSASISAGIV